MKFIITLLLVLFIAGVTLSEEIKKTEDGIYYQHVGIEKKGQTAIGKYIVDPSTQQCFFALWHTGGVTVISSDKLKKRPEWKEIITWND